MKYKHIILGGTGHIGSVLANTLLSQGKSVLVIGHAKEKAAEWIQKGAGFEAVDILDRDALQNLFVQGERLFILNPPAPPSTDTVAEERKGIFTILSALENTHLQKIVAASAYGAQLGDRLGDLGVLYQMEQALATQQVPVAIIRSAYYMSNWDMLLTTVQQSGTLPTLYPANFKLPMVAPADIGTFAAELMVGTGLGLYFIEGPERYSPNDVAAAFSEALHKPVKVMSTPEEQWLESLKQSGFSEPAAEYMVNMTTITLADNYEVAAPAYGQTTLKSYISQMVKH